MLATSAVDAGLQVFDNWRTGEPLLNINRGGVALSGMLSFPVGGMTGWGAPLWRIATTAAGIGGGRNLLSQLFSGDDFSWRRLGEATGISAVFAFLGGNAFNLEAIPFEIRKSILWSLGQGIAERWESIAEFIRNLLNGGDDFEYTD